MRLKHKYENNELTFTVEFTKEEVRALHFELKEALIKMCHSNDFYTLKIHELDRIMKEAKDITYTVPYYNPYPREPVYGPNPANLPQSLSNEDLEKISAFMEKKNTVKGVCNCEEFQKALQNDEIKIIDSPDQQMIGKEVWYHLKNEFMDQDVLIFKCPFCGKKLWSD